MRIEPTSFAPPAVSDLQREVQSRGEVLGLGNPQAHAAPEQQDPKTPEQLDKMVEQMNETVKVFGHHLQFEAVRPNRIVIRIVDSASGQIITEIPPEKLIKAFEGMEKTLGMLLDEKS